MEGERGRGGAKRFGSCSGGGGGGEGFHLLFFFFFFFFAFFLFSGIHRQFCSFHILSNQIQTSTRKIAKNTKISGLLFVRSKPGNKKVKEKKKNVLN